MKPRTGVYISKFGDRLSPASEISPIDPVQETCLKTRKPSGPVGLETHSGPENRDNNDSKTIVGTKNTGPELSHQTLRYSGVLENCYG